MNLTKTYRIIRRLTHIGHLLSSGISRKLDQWEIRNLPPQEEGLSPDLWDMTCGPNGHLMIQGCDSLSLAKQYGTPLYVVDKARLKKNYIDFRDSFQKRYPRIEISYSYKTNPLPGVLKALHEFGAGAEVVSPFELWLALNKLNVSPENIIFNGPGKTEEALDMAVSNNIKLININGPEEIETIGKLAGRYARKQQVGVRVITSVGWKSKFGFEIKGQSAFKAFRDLKGLQYVDPCCLHVHIGSGVHRIDKYLQAIKDVLELSKLIKRELDISIRYFDFGGGFGVPTVRGYSQLDFKLFKNNLPPRVTKVSTCPTINEYSQKIIELFGDYYSDVLDDPPTIILEPGRSITSSAQSLLLKALEIRPSENEITTVVVDGGKPVAGPVGREYHEIFHASKTNEPRNSLYSICGPTCTPQDVLCPVKRLPTLKRGDVLAIMDAGAYLVPTQSNFSFPRAPAVLVENGHHELIRKSESFEHIVALDSFQ
ncbi:MAG: hypothetical protein ABIN18_12470 [Pseudomonadota bacterium]